MLKTAVFVSGRGSNLIAIFDHIKEHSVNAEISLVVSNSQKAKALDFCKDQNIEFCLVSNKPHDKFITYKELTQRLVDSGINLIILAGFLKKIPSELVNSFEDKIINIHPALLPSFGGEGMYGVNVHNAVFNSSAKVSGVTIHFVNNRFDEGKIIAQRCVDISDVNSPEEIASKVLKVEHKLLPMIVQKFAENKIESKNNRVFVK